MRLTLAGGAPGLALAVAAGFGAKGTAALGNLGLTAGTVRAAADFGATLLAGAGGRFWADITGITSDAATVSNTDFRSPNIGNSAA